MTVEQFETYLVDLGDGDFILRMRHFADKIESHAAYRGPPPDWVPGAGRIRGDADQLSVLVAAVAEDKQREPERAACRLRGSRDMTFATQWIVMFADHHNDPSLLENLGLELKQRSYTHRTDASTRLPGRPGKLSVKNIERKSGSIAVIVSKWQGKGSVELWYCDTDPKDEAAWRKLKTSYDCRFHQDGLEPVKKYHFKARYDSPAGPGPWSDVVTLVVI